MSSDDRKTAGQFDKYDEAIDHGGAPAGALHARDRERMRQAEVRLLARRKATLEAPTRIVEALRLKGAMQRAHLFDASGITDKKLFGQAIIFLRAMKVIAERADPRDGGRH